MFDAGAIRSQFPILQRQVHGHPLVYLDNAATTQKPQCVLDTLLHHYQNANANVHRGAHALGIQATHAFESARHTVQRFIGASRSEEIIWTRGATEAINLVASTWGQMNIQAGDHVVVTALEHHANFVPWKTLCDTVGAHLVVIPLIEQEARLDLDALYEALEKRPALLAMTHYSNALGNAHPVEAICARARELGVTTVIDGAQAVAHCSVDVQAIGCDFYVFSGHKMYAPTGIGVLYGRYDVLNAMPPWQVGGEMVAHVSVDDVRYQPPPLRFEAGTPPAAEAIALARAAEFVEALRAQGAEQHERALMQSLRSALAARPLIRVCGSSLEEEWGSSVSILIEGHHAHDVAQWLDRRGIAVRTGHHCAMPLMQAMGVEGTLRVSLACYNTADDLNVFFQALDEYLRVEGLPEPVNDDINLPLYQQLKDGRDWQSRYRTLLLAGKAAPRWPQLHTQEYHVPGCESQTWLTCRVEGQQRVFQADSDSKLIRGVLQLVGGLWEQGHSVGEIADALHEFGLEQHLSASRSNGIHAILRTLDAFDTRRREPH